MTTNYDRIDALLAAVEKSHADFEKSQARLDEVLADNAEFKLELISPPGKPQKGHYYPRVS